MPLESIKDDLVLANRILANEGFLDAFGHMTGLHPDGDKIVISAYQSPALVKKDDLIEMSLEGKILTEGVEEIYSENVIHRSIYRNRSDVGAVVHGHAKPLIPFTVTEKEIKPVTHMAAMFHEGVPLFNDYDPERGKLVVTENEGERMARQLGEKRAQLLAGHGANVVGESVRETMVLALQLMNNAEHQLASEGLGTPEYFTGPRKFLEKTTNDTLLKPRTIERAWDFWVNRLPPRRKP